MPQRVELSAESAELRRLLRQDLSELLLLHAPWRGGDRQEVETNGAHVHAASPNGKQNSHVEADRSLYEGLLRDSAEQRQELARVAEAVDRLSGKKLPNGGGGGAAASDAPGVKVDWDKSDSSPPQAVHKKLSARRHTSPREVAMRTIARINELPEVVAIGGEADVCRTSSDPALEDPTSPALEDPTSSLNEMPAKEKKYHWEWERSNDMGWQRYTTSVGKRIEKAWREGHSRVRLKSGQEGRTPMEIFLVDMIQLDPQSQRTRSIRRVGEVTPWMNFTRHFNAVFNQMRNGEPRWETHDQYRMRQEAVLGGSTVTLRPLLRATRSCQTKDLHVSPLRKGLTRIAKNESTLVLSMIVTLAQSIWIGVEVDKDSQLPIHEKPPYAQALDYFFCVFFTVDLILHVFQYDPLKSCLSNSWFCFDAFCVAGSLIEVLIVTPINAFTQNSVADWNGFGAIRVVRLVKVLRVWRIFSASADAGPFFVGLVSGMRSAAFIWGIIIAMLYFFSVLLRLYAAEASKELYFMSLPRTMINVAVRGIMLDEVGEMLATFVDVGDIFSLLIFVSFVWVTYFNLLSMLIGSFCSVAGEVSAAEKDSAEICYLKQHLEKIVECYINDETIGRAEFKLIMSNADVCDTLIRCGTDIEQLDSLETLLYDQDHNEEIDFQSFFKAIVHLRKGKLATVKDIIVLQETVNEKIDLLLKELKLRG